MRRESILSAATDFVFDRLHPPVRSLRHASELKLRVSVKGLHPVSDSSTLWTVGTQSMTAHARSAALTVWAISVEIVIGPTPPGTGVTAAHRPMRPSG